MIKHKRVVVYIPEEDYKNLRSKLILLGKTVSGWIRKIIKDFLDD
jgi:hypothetical protein